MTISAERAAVANAFLFRCGGIQDLALTYLKEALKLGRHAAGAPALTPPPRGTGERLLDWLDAARQVGAESPALAALREALQASPNDPPPLAEVAAITPVVTGDCQDSSVRRIANIAHGLEKTNAAGAVAAYWTALLIDQRDEISNFNLAAHYMRESEWTKAAQHLEMVLESSPDHRAAMTALHNLAFETNEMARFAPHLERFVRLSEQPAEDDGDGRAPVIELTATNGVGVGKLVLGRGVAHVRSAVRPEVCARLQQDARSWFSGNPELLSVPLLKYIPEYEDPSLILEPAMLAALFTIFGRKPDVSAADTYLRRVAPGVTGTYIPFHQDATALANAGLNVWIPLTDCGVDAPGLEIMARRTASILPTIASAGDYNQMEIDPALVYQSFPEETRFYPTPKVGDAVLFLGSTVHRSHIAEGMTRERASVELRFY